MTRYLYIQGEGFVKVMGSDNAPVPVMLVKTPQAKRYSSYRLIQKDLLHVRSALSELNKADVLKDVVRQALTASAVVSYSKCFVASNGRGIKLETVALKYCSDTEKATHTEIMTMRNQYIAHSGMGPYERNPVIMYERQTENDSDPFTFSTYDNLIYITSFDSRIASFEGLIENLLKFVNEKISNAWTDMMQNLSDTITKEKFDAFALRVDPECLFPLHDIDETHPVFRELAEINNMDKKKIR